MTTITRSRKLAEDRKNTEIQKKETARDLRKKNTRLFESRETVKAKSFQKSVEIKALNGKAGDLAISRDKWKDKCQTNEKKYKELNEEHSRLKALMQEQERLFNLEKELQQKEHKNAYEVLFLENEELKKKRRN